MREDKKRVPFSFNVFSDASKITSNLLEDRPKSSCDEPPVITTTRENGYSSLHTSVYSKKQLQFGAHPQLRPAGHAISCGLPFAAQHHQIFFGCPCFQHQDGSSAWSAHALSVQTATMPGFLLAPEVAALEGSTNPCPSATEKFIYGFNALNAASSAANCKRTGTFAISAAGPLCDPLDPLV